MLGNYVSCTQVVTSVTLYRSAVVDLSRSRSIHAVEHDPCCPDPIFSQGSVCRSVHYGLCSPLLKLPPFVIPISPASISGKPGTTSVPGNRTPTPPNTPTGTKNNVSPLSFTPSVRDIPKSSPVSSSPSTPTSPTSPITLSPFGNRTEGSPPLHLIGSGFDPVRLLAEADFEGQLEALVTSFVAQDKVRLAARKSQPSSPEGGKNDPVSVSGSPGGAGSSTEANKTERRVIRRPGVEVVGGKLVPVASNYVAQNVKSTSNLPEYRREGGGVKAQIDRFAPDSTLKPLDVGKGPDLSSPSVSRSPISPPAIGQMRPLLNANVISPSLLVSKDVSPKKGPVLETSVQGKRTLVQNSGPSSTTQRAQTMVNENQVDIKSGKLRNGHVVGQNDGKWEDGNVSLSKGCDREWLNQNSMAKDSASVAKAPSPERGAGDGPTIPHPKLTTVQRQHMRERSLSPTDRHHHSVTNSTVTRPFLSKGSVAERVLLFERAPSAERSQTVHPANNQSGLVTGYQSGATANAAGRSNVAAIAKPASPYSTWRSGQLSSDAILKQQKNKENVEPGLKTGSLRRLPKTATRATHDIPRFYYPNGKPMDSLSVENQLKKVAQAFASVANNRGGATLQQFDEIAKACNFPLYCKASLFQAAGGDKRGWVNSDIFLDYWRRIINSCHEDSSKFVRVLSGGKRGYLIPEDFISMIQDMIETHPGLTFLKEAPEFHSRYVHTVISRIFYCVNRSWTGKITPPEVRKSNLLSVLHLLEEEEDINQITEYFSYEHFYVIYCKFWELDKDHDLFIDKSDLSRHNDGAISSRMIDRIFSGAVTRGPVIKHGKMSYSEFVWFLISEEDKRHPRSIEYWFRCMDIDGDGFLSMYELEYFYDEQMHRMEVLGIETLPFKDCLCQMLDMISPKVPGCISLSDLKRCKMTPVFFDTFFNLEKYLDHEQRDPFASQRDHEEMSLSDWDRFASEEYELLVSEESANEQMDDMMYDEYEEKNAQYQQGFNNVRQPIMNAANNRALLMDDEDYDYAETDTDHY